MKVAAWSLACVAVFLSVQSARAEECEKVLEGKKLELNLPEYRSPGLIELSRRISAINNEIDELEAKMASNGTGKAFGFALRKVRSDEADNQATELKKTIAVLKSEKTTLRKSIQIAKEENRQSLIQLFREQRSIPEFAKYFNDYRQVINFNRLPENEVVPVLVGSRERAPTEQEIEAYTELVSQLVARNYTVVYDADNQASSYIAAAAGVKGIGISMAAEPPSFQTEGLLARFNNTYSFIEILRHSWATVVSPENLLGQAAMLDNDATFVLDVRPDGELKNDLFDWYKTLNKGVEEETIDEKGESKKVWKSTNTFGVSFQRLGIYKTADGILKASYSREGSKKKRLVFSQIHEPKIYLKFFKVPVKKMSFEEIEHLLEYRDIMMSGSEKLNGVRGAAVFGTSQLDEAVANDSYALGFNLGKVQIPVITGGAGGVMYAANMGAYDTGAESIGIPMVGRGLLDYEVRIQHEVQTRTVPALDYNARVPLLINNRDFIFVEPGGMGTFREFAASLVALQYSKRQPYIFVIGDYYEPLQKFLKNLELSPALREHIIFVQDQVEANRALWSLPHIRDLYTEAYRDLRIHHLVTGRNRFPKEEFEKAEKEE